MSKIRIANGPYRGREKTLHDKKTTIGRDAEAGVQILDRSASRFHCELFPVGGMWFIRDLDSKNGTFVNDERLKDEELLRVGDVIKIGTTELVYESGTALADDDSSARISYNEDPEMLSNTLEFRVDELSDLSEPAEQTAARDQAKGLRILYQIGRILSEPSDAPPDARVLDCLVQALPCEAAIIFRRDTVSGKLVPGSVRTSAAHVQPVISRSIIKKTFTENKAVHSADAQDDERFQKHASIVSKGIRAVICVPLPVGGVTRGVVYLSRSAGAAPFDQFDLEVASATALQLGMAQFAGEERRKARSGTRQAVEVMVRALESAKGWSGSGERAAKAAVAIATAMGLDAEAQGRLYLAGLVAHLPKLIAGGADEAWTLLERIEELEGPLAIARQAAGSDEEPDTEARVLAVVDAFESRIRADPAADAGLAIDAVLADTRLDRHLAQLLQACHLDGSLYR